MARAQIDAVSFDATGTLFAPRDVGGDYARVLARHGLALDPAMLGEHLATAWREFACRAHPARDRFAAHPGGARGYWGEVLERACALAGAPRPSPFAAAELFEHYARPEAWEVFPEVHDALAELMARGLRLAVVSNWDARLPRLLAALGLAEPFEAIVVSEAVDVEKPHPRIFAVLCERLRLPPERILHVGDRELEDVEGALAAGLRALRVARAGEGDISSLAEIAGHLDGLA
jgi:putative hydrolase of the HAD superfamily